VEKFTKILGKNGTNNSGQTENKTDKYVVQKVFLMLRMPSLPAIFGQETLISGCYDLAKFALITWLISLATPPPPPHSKRFSAAPEGINHKYQSTVTSAGLFKSLADFKIINFNFY
jgi:hypothetical protein